MELAFQVLHGHFEPVCLLQVCKNDWIFLALIPEKMSIDGRSSPSPSPSASGVSSEIIEVLKVGLVAASTVIVLVLNRSGAM